MIADNLYSQDKFRIQIKDNTNFYVAHYTGRVMYDCKKMPEKNRDFLPPEIIETMRRSGNPTISHFFSSKLDRNGNLISVEESRPTRFRLASKV